MIFTRRNRTRIRVEIRQLWGRQARRHQVAPGDCYWKVTSYGTLVDHGYAASIPTATDEASRAILGID